MTTQSRRYVYDLLDRAGLFPFGNEAAIFGRALDAFTVVFKRTSESKKPISDFATVHRTDTRRSPDVWGEDSALGAPPIELGVLDFIRWKQIATLERGFSAGSYSTTAIESVERSFGTLNTLRFLDHAWRCYTLIELNDTAQKMYLLHRAILRGISFRESESELQEAMTKTKADDDGLIPREELVGNIKIKLGSEIGFSELSDYIEMHRDEAERGLSVVNSELRYSDWINGLRNLCPRYLALHRLLLETIYTTSDPRTRSEFDRYDRFVDERCVDMSFIGRGYHRSVLMLAEFDIRSAQKESDRKFAIRAHSKGRIMFPLFIAERLLKAHGWTLQDSEALTADVVSHLRPGHRFWFARPGNTAGDIPRQEPVGKAGTDPARWRASTMQPNLPAHEE